MLFVLKLLETSGNKRNNSVTTLLHGSNAYDEELLTAPADTHETRYLQDTLVKATKFNYRQRSKVTSIILLEQLSFKPICRELQRILR